MQIFEMGEVQGELFMCMELVSGCDRGQLLARRRMDGKPTDPGLAVWIVREICRGLDTVTPRPCGPQAQGLSSGEDRR